MRIVGAGKPESLSFLRAPKRYGRANMPAVAPGVSSGLLVEEKGKRPTGNCGCMLGPAIVVWDLIPDTGRRLGGDVLEDQAEVVVDSWLGIIGQQPQLTVYSLASDPKRTRWR